MTVSRRYLLLAAVLGASAASLPAAAGSEATPTIEAVNVGLSHYWSPAQASVAPGGKVTLSNSTTTPHGVEWVGGPATPTCEGGVPVGTTSAASGTKWSGACTFTQAGTYTFYCTVHGPEMTGTVTVTIPGAPIVATGAASSVGETQATLKGTVNPQEKASTYFFNYGTSTSYGAKTSEQPVEEGNVAKTVSLPVGSLLPGTLYHFQLVAKNGSGTTLGEDGTFTTASPPGPPAVTTGVVSAPGETTATLKGTVNPDGLATTYFFEWGTTTGYGQSTPELPAGADHLGHGESSALTGLAPGRVYHFRLLAKNSSGTVPGLDGTFTTGSPPPPSPPAPTPTPPSNTPAATITQSLPAVASTVPTIAPSAPPSGSPLIGAPSLSSSQHGSTVKGTLDVSSAGAGGHVEVDLLVKGALLAKGRSGSVRVGRLLHSSLASGKVPFSVVLTASGKRALAHRHRLAVTVKITLTPPHGKALTVTRSVVLRS